MSKKLTGKAKQNARRKLKWQKEKRRLHILNNDFEKDFEVKPPQINKEVRALKLKVEVIKKENHEGEEVDIVRAEAKPHFGFTPKEIANFKDVTSLKYDIDLDSAFNSMSTEMIKGDFDNLTAIMFIGLEMTKQGIAVPLEINGKSMIEIVGKSDLVLFNNLTKEVKDDVDIVRKITTNREAA